VFLEIEAVSGEQLFAMGIKILLPWGKFTEKITSRILPMSKTKRHWKLRGRPEVKCV